ncbi:tRNA (mnm(5)s(2)U34)-methyltransferase / FAD-dependent cmnm(5)s(2)U34 oxidoreductase [Shewanella benthica]|uniref:tRNA 5-methylaminomethyl-2-thiouridine biosynthesis bifunctional protein MnmC n=1 Tax=Shewanella benthica TaxID=43661 RepID=A0A330M567_9GAMM|nr:tRNA (mnm(5)s(2)U34)-methyltransferase / FAD-dependent cmnm(5)s(2)U34 oxidoreductase [Shewanella benthica]
MTQEREEKMVNSRICSHFDSFYEQIARMYPDKKKLSLGQIGLCDVQQMLSVIILQQKSMADTRFYVKVFEADYSAIERINLQLVALQTQYQKGQACQEPAHTDLGSRSGFDSDLASEYESSSCLDRQAAIKQLIDAKLVAIPGCQRLILNQGRCLIDLYLGDIHSSLSNTLAPAYQASYIHAWLHTSDKHSLDEQTLWQMAKLSSNAAMLSSSNMSQQQVNLAQIAGFTLTDISSTDASLKDCLLDARAAEKTSPSPASAQLNDEISQQERQALRQAQANGFQHYPQLPAKEGEIAVIGGGIASTHLALSLAERNKSVRLFCQDEAFSQQASGNKQGAIYPLLTPDNGTLSQYFQQGLLFTRRRLTTLIDEGFNIANELCGVLHTGHDERSRGRINRIISAQAWPKEIAHRVSAQEASNLASIDIDQEGVFYPLGGWISPPDFTQAAFDKASQIADVSALFNCNITRIEQSQGQWYLYQNADAHSENGSVNEVKHGPFSTLVLANGRGLTQFEQSKLLPATGFRGQVSHIPARNELAKLTTVLCSHGYLTPSNDQLHCTGASYVKDPEHLDYCPNEQLDNLKKMQHSFENKAWVDDIDITGHSARVGVRMVTRDHAPMLGCAPDTHVMLENYQLHQHTKASIKFWKDNPAPIHHGLFILGGLGSRGITTGPLAAEALASQLCGEIIPLDMATLALLNPNRMWMRKLIKGKAL